MDFKQGRGTGRYITCQHYEPPLLESSGISVQLPDIQKQRQSQAEGWRLPCNCPVSRSRVTSHVPIRSSEAPGDGQGRCPKINHDGKRNAKATSQVGK